MSYKVKPEDISEVLISWAEDSVGLGNGAWDCVDVQELCAAILNAAIEAGLVSPPCWEVFGESLVPVTVFKSREDAEKWTEVDNGFRKVGFRHWKGQTE